MNLSAIYVVATAVSVIAIAAAWKRVKKDNV